MNKEDYKRRFINLTEGMDDPMAPFQTQPQAPPGTPLGGAVEEAPSEAPSRPRYTQGNLRELYPDTASLMGDLLPERNVEREQYHKKTARLDALGRAIGSVGGFISAEMGGPVGQPLPGKSREHMDRYEQLLLDYQEKDRAHELLTLQEQIREGRTFADILRDQDTKEFEDKRRDFEYERGREDRESEIQGRQDHDIDMLGQRTKAQKDIIKKQEKMQVERERRENTRREIEAQKIARAGTTGEPDDKQFTFRYAGRNAPVSAAVAREMAARLPLDKQMDLFQNASGIIDYTDRNLEKMLANYGKEHLVLRDITDDQGNVIRQEFDVRTQAQSSPDPQDVGGLLVEVRDKVLSGEFSEGQVVGMFQTYLDEQGAPGMAITDANRLGEAIGRAMVVPAEYTDDGRVVHPLQNIPLPKGMKTPQNWPKGLEKSVWNYLIFFDPRGPYAKEEAPRTPRGGGSAAAEAHYDYLGGVGEQFRQR